MRIAQISCTGRLLCSIICGLSLCGCGALARAPELNPDRYAAQRVDQAWIPSAKQDYAPAVLLPHTPPASTQPAAPELYSLHDLVNLALEQNPDTRAAWEQARAQAANWAVTRAKYYPTVSAETDIEYSRELFQVPGATARIKTSQITPFVNLTYTLIDFGRRSNENAAARAQLTAANFSFNRRMQDVVFAAERSYYALAASRAAVDAAHQNLRLARTDDDAVGQRVNHGLATKPELLLSRQRVTQAEYDVANAELMVEQAQASLALALGIRANEEIRVAGLNGRTTPQLDAQLDQLIEQSIRARPDLAADAATVQANQAQVARARAEFTPEVDLLGSYGEQNWQYNFNGAPLIKTNTPQYSALVALKWNIFTGFSRINTLRADAARERASEAELKSRELTAIAEVWRAYYEFQSSRKRYDYARALLAASEESYNALIDTYRQGLSTIVELLSAERDLANARYIMIQATADLLTASAATAYAVGATYTAP